MNFKTLQAEIYTAPDKMHISTEGYMGIMNFKTLRAMSVFTTAISVSSR